MFLLLSKRADCGINREQYGDLPRAWRSTARELAVMSVPNLPRIDWHTDPSSGFRWQSNIRSACIKYGDQPGVEVKWPWEIGRLQHLPPIAGQICDPNSEHGRLSASVIKHHIVDFVRSNPPGFGVQWLCPMDVGIRIANLLVAVDLARAAGVDFELEFLQLVSATSRDHARYLAQNLEWGERLCSNHYLANISGLLYVGAYLHDDREGSEWLAFAGREMVHQIRAQFHPDGSNFEASTCYHRLSAEMALHSAALMLWIARNQPERAGRWWSGSVRCFHPSPAAPPTPRVEWAFGLAHPFDEELQRRLYGMGRFTEATLRPDGSIPQVGDNDSGRFMRLEMSDQPYADLDDFRHLVQASRALFGTAGKEQGLEARWMARWLDDAVLTKPDDTETGLWRDFGLFVWQRRGFTLTLRCGDVGQGGNGGHAHCDQLSITLATDDGALIDDPGTGVYTPLPEVRNELRSSACHSTVLVPEQEQGEWLPGRWGLFAMRDRSKAKLLHYDEAGASAEMFQGDNLVRRRIEIRGRRIRIIDNAPVGAVANFVLAPGVGIDSIQADLVVLRFKSTVLRIRGSVIRVDECPYSSRYGQVARTSRIQCATGLVELELA